MSVPTAVLNDIVSFVENDKKLKFANPIDRHRGFFVRRRAEFIGSEAANAWMVTESGQITLISRIYSEYLQLDSYIAAKAKALNPATGGVDVTPPHLDLHDLAKPKETTSASDVNSNEQVYRSKRAYRVRAICWRAAAIHNDLWDASTDGRTAKCRTQAMDELLDRRLHTVERMNFQIARAEALIHGGSWSFTGGGEHGPWKDGFRVRLFEYPRIPRNVVSQVATFLGPANIAAENGPEYDPHAPEWRWEVGRKRLIYNVGPWPGIRLGPKMMFNWRAETDAYFVDLIPSTDQPAAAIDLMFTAAPEWWHRDWLYCDQVVSALHIEALLFASRRRDPVNGETQFNALVKGHPSWFVAIGAFFGDLGDQRLMGGGKTDPHFDNLEIDERDLQIGDHLIFWNSRIFHLISASEWSLENSLVLDVDSDPATGGIRRNLLTLQGHGTLERIYANYLALDIAPPFNEALGQVRRAIKAAVLKNPSVKSLDWNRRKNILVRWDPYESFPSPGAWWIRVDLKDTDGTVLWKTTAEAQAAVLGSIVDAPHHGSGYTSPPAAQAVYFPLYRPAFKDWWSGYLDARRSNPTLKIPKLVEFKADGSVIPGLFYDGQGKPIPVIRPKVTP